MTYSDDEHIDYIIDNFNFKKVKKHMEENKWTWGFANTVPTINQLKSTAFDLLMQIKDEESDHWVSTGGFTAMKGFDSLRLMFSIDDVDSDFVNLKDTYDKDKNNKERKIKLEIIDGISS